MKEQLDTWTAKIMEMIHTKDSAAQLRFKKGEGFLKSWHEENLTPEGLRRRYLEAGIADRHLHATRENIHPALWESVSGFFAGQSYCLWGPVGTGKTYLVSALFKEKIRKDVARVIDGLIYLPPLPRRIKVVDLLREIKGTIREEKAISEESIIRRYAACRCLALDDVGVDKPTEWVIETLYSLVDQRYEKKRQTIFTSNLSLKALKNRLGDRISSRIAEMCGRDNVIRVEGKDRRFSGWDAPNTPQPSGVK